MNPGERFPAPILRDARHGGEVPLRAPARGSVVLFLSHGTGCERCQAYVAELASADDTFRIWGGRGIAVISDEREAAAAAVPDLAAPRFSVVADAAGGLPDRLGLRPPALLVSDRFGECYACYGPECGGDTPAASTGEKEEDPHASLPELGAVTEWLSFLGTQCPECGVPDTAGRGEWAHS